MVGHLLSFSLSLDVPISLLPLPLLLPLHADIL